MKKVLSIIIPVYGVERYIEECMRSITCQITEDVEVIVVNDGTSDRSIEIAKNVVSELPKDLQSCFFFLDQENQGQSVARNNGLKRAKGEYLSFLDSDDVLDKNYIKKIIEKIEKLRPDIIRFQSFRFENNINNAKTFDLSCGFTNLCDNSKNVKIALFNLNAWFPWLNVYKKDLFFGGLEFPEKVYYEDAILMPEIFLKAKKIYFMSDRIYYYRINAEGSLLSISERNIEKHIFSYNYVIDVFRKRVLVNDLYTPVYVSFCQSYINYLINFKGFSYAFNKYNDLNFKNVDINTELLTRIGNRFFCKFGFLYFFISRILGRD